MSFLAPTKLTVPHNESGTATTIGGVISGIVTATLIAQWPAYSEIWVAVGTLITVLVGFGLKKYNAS